jgi:hypothetical protein
MYLWLPTVFMLLLLSQKSLDDHVSGTFPIDEITSHSAIPQWCVHQKVHERRRLVARHESFAEVAPDPGRAERDFRLLVQADQKCRVPSQTEVVSSLSDEGE